MFLDFFDCYKFTGSEHFQLSQGQFQEELWLEVECA